jgi:taurine dioxygenase
MHDRISHTSLAPFGVEVSIDLSAPLTPTELTAAEKDELRRLYARDGLLVLRGLKLSMEEQCEFCRIFGPVLDSPYENFYVSNTRQDGHLGVLELQWHNDVPYLPRPYLAAALHAVDVVPGATSTQFASGFRAYERLAPALRERIVNLNALQVKQRHSDRCNRLTDLQPGDLCTVHPVLRQQPGTARPYLFVNENMTPLIIGLPPAESDALLQELFAALYVPDEVYEHAWYPGDLVLWDNLAVQHARGRVSADTRTLQRVSITELSYAQQYAADLDIRDAYGNGTLLTPAA